MGILDHGIKNVEDLYMDSRELYNTSVMSKADSIIGDLTSAINNLRENWKGADAGVNITDVIEICREITEVRNRLADLARDANAIAVMYRKIQEGNRANLGDLPPISIVSRELYKNDYSDTADTIYIRPEAVVGKDSIGTAAKDIQAFVDSARLYKNKILDNWYMGPGRNQADDAFDAFDKSSKAKQAKLEEVANIVGKAIDSYGG